MLLLLVILLAFSMLLKNGNVIDVTDALMLAGKKGFTIKYSK